MQQVVYSTASGNKYPIEINWKVISYSDIVYDPQKVMQLCKTGCRNYGKSGGCPPYAPRFENAEHDGRQYLLFIGKFYSKYKTAKVKSCKNRAIHWKFQDVILARFLDKMGRILTSLLNGNFWNTGYCMGCPGKKCSFKFNEPCRNPKKRTFSMEATGINVVETVKLCLGEKFYWYSKNNADIPYMMKAVLISTTKTTNEINRIIEEVLNGLEPGLVEHNVYP